MKTKAGSVLLQPGECLAVFELFLQYRVTRRAEVQGSSAVVFAETGRSRNTEYVVDGLALFEFSPQDAFLVCYRAEGLVVGDCGCSEPTRDL